MNNNVILELAEKNSYMVDIDKLSNVFHCLSQALVFGVPGDIVELGCNEGMTSVFLEMIIQNFAPERRLHVYDSFMGLPEPREEDCLPGQQSYLKRGDCFGKKDALIRNFQQRGLRLPSIHEGWFNETLPKDLPPKIAFAFLDSDFYEPIMQSLEAIYPRLSPNAVVVLDDYCDAERNPRAWRNLPGVKLACDEFFRDKPERVDVLVGTGDMAFGYFRKAGKN